MERTLNDQIRAKEEESTRQDDEIAKCNETITGLEAQQHSLKQSLNEQKSMLDASKEDEISQLRGTVANLESKLKSEVEKLENAGIVSQGNVQELEEIIRKGQLERKRMHNIIQELRGNVRVFARIRPFLPGDGKQDDGGIVAPSVLHKGDSVVSVVSIEVIWSLVFYRTILIVVLIYIPCCCGFTYRSKQMTLAVDISSRSIKSLASLLVKIPCLKRFLSSFNHL